MIPDQATELRKLVLQSMRETTPRTLPAPRLVVLCGGQEGVGVTTVAINLSIALAMQGARPVLVDANPDHPEIAAHLGLDPGYREAVATRLDIHEVLVRGPAGVLVVPGLWSHTPAETINEIAQHRLIHQLQGLGRHADVVLLDLGHQSLPAVDRFWGAADHVMIVTTSDVMSITNGYATVKRNSEAARNTAMHLVVNRVDDPAGAQQVHQRFEQSCQRFLQVNIGLLGYVPFDASMEGALRSHVPELLGRPNEPFAKSIERIAGFWSSERLNPGRAAA